MHSSWVPHSLSKSIALFSVIEGAWPFVTSSCCLWMMNAEISYKSICDNSHTNAYKAVREEGVKGNLATKLSQLRCGINEVVCHIKDSLLGNSLRKNNSL